MGASVYPGSEKEIGWFPISGHPNPSSCFSFPPSIDVFHWHGETFDLPKGVTLLASSAACRHQAFQMGRRVLGLQFHLETTPASADAMIANCRHELIAQQYVQTEPQLRATPDAAYAGINALMTNVLDYLASGMD
jgi:GMP synthase-like glutamine amidotransferase